MLRLTPVVKYLLIINVLLFIASQTIDLDALALYYPWSGSFRPFQIVTHFFMHGGIAHLFFNMFALVMFGSILESLWGPKRFLFFYIFCALGAAALHVLVNFYEVNAFNKAVAAYQANPSHQAYFDFFDKYENTKRLLNTHGEAQFKQIAIDLKNKTPDSKEASTRFIGDIAEAYFPYITPRIVGASGAIFGLLLAFGMLFPNMELMLIFLPIPIKAKYFIPILMAIELFLGVNQFSWDNIAHFAHLGGALFGLILILYWRKTGEGRR